MQEHEQIQIKGIVLPVDWEKHGIIVTVAIMSDSFEKFIVAETTKGSELLNFVDKEALVRAKIIGEDVEGNLVIAIDSYEIIENDMLAC